MESKPHKKITNGWVIKRLSGNYKEKWQVRSIIKPLCGLENPDKICVDPPRNDFVCMCVWVCVVFLCDCMCMKK